MCISKRPTAPGKSLTLTSRSRNSIGYLKLLQKIGQALPKWLIYLLADILKTHESAKVGELRGLWKSIRHNGQCLILRKVAV